MNILCVHIHVQPVLYQLQVSTNDLSSSVVYSGTPTPVEGTVNATLVFIRSELCLFSPGGKEMTLFYTGKRSENTKVCVCVCVGGWGWGVYTLDV